MKRPWYADGLRFECTRCGDCCRGEPGFVWVDREEARRLAALLGLPVKQFRERFCRRVSDRTSLKERPNWDCIFWDGGCTVYEARPRQCRTFPFWSQNLTDRNEWEYVKSRCPGCGKGRLHTLAEIREILDSGPTP
jgi:Fe-S-cluster containining protein